MTKPPGKMQTRSVVDIPQSRSISEWIGVFQWEEYGDRHAEVRQGQAMAHFNVFLARHGGLPSKVGKRSHMVNAPIGELNAAHFRDFLGWIPAQAFHEDVGKEWYAPTLAKFIQWLKDNKAITDGKRREFFSALKTSGAQH